MAYPGLAWQKLELPFAAGLQQQTDDRARPQPFLDICKDVQFDEVGGLQTRYPYAAMSNSIFGGGTLSNCRRLAVVNSELCVFTDTALYSWNAQLAAWVLRGTHPAVTVDASRRFASGGDQFTCDRAELSGTVVYTWLETSGILGGNIFVAALDKTTGSVLMAPTIVTVSGVGFSSRVVALATKILLFVQDGGGGGHNLTARAIDPAAPATGVAAAGTSILALTAGTSFDVVRQLGADTAVGVSMLNPATSYVVFTVTAGLSVTQSTKARTADGVVAVASRPSSGTQTHILRSVTGTTAILGDVVTTSTLADVATAQAIGTFTAPINHLTACYRSVQTAGRFVCVVFWTAREFSQALPETKFNTVDDAGTIGTQATFNAGVAVASRAFDYSGAVYVNTIFAADNQGASFAGPSLQNTYFLYREDGTLVSKALPGVAGGFESTAMSPGVASVGGNSFAWAGSVRRSLVVSAAAGGLPEGGGNVYAARSLADVTITFDANAARRTARLGRTLYISGGEILTYDGVRIVECGFNVFGYSLAPVDGGAATGSVALGTYACKGTFSTTNAQGEFERSTTAAVNTVVIAANASSISYPSASGPLCTTRKLAPNVPAFEIWRTAVGPGIDAPFYLTTSQDPNASTNPNRHLSSASAIPAFTDALSDASLTVRETNPENGSVLESLAPPGATIIASTDTRLLLAGVTGDPDRVWPSRQRNDGEVASFHDSLAVGIPRAGGDITAAWFQDETLYVSRATALYVLPGDGVDNLGVGQGFGPARIVSLDVGAVSQEAVALTPHGTIFLSRKGWQLLDRSGVLQHIGGPVSDYNSETVVSVDVVETQHQVRILTTARMLVWAYPRPDFPGGQWGEWTISDGIHSLMWNGTHVYLTATGPKQQQTTYTSLTYGQDVEEAWIKLNGLMGAARCRRLQPLGEYRSAFLLRVRIAYNYDPTYVEDFAWTPSPTTVGGPLQMMHAPARPRCEAIKVRLTAVTEVTRAALVTSGLAVSTSGTAWSSTWSAATARPGEMGNAVSMALSFEAGANLVDVRDHFTYTAATGWTPSLNRIGVRVRSAAGTLTVAALEAAIAAGTALATLGTPDATPSKTISAAMAGTVVSASFAGGTYGTPTGEALKLTGLGIEVGVEKANLYTGLARAQKA